MKAYIEINDQGKPDKSRTLFRELVSLGDNEGNVDFIKDANYDFGEQPNLNIYVIEGDVSTESVEAACQKSISDGLKVNLILSKDSFDLSESDIEVQYYRKNKQSTKMVHQTDCNVEIRHIPSGLAVKCERFRSKHKNKEEAKCYLASKVAKKCA